MPRSSKRNSSVPPEILSALAKAPSGLSPGQLRERLLCSQSGQRALQLLSTGGKRAPSAELRDAAYQWWESRQIFIEPPRPGKATVRLWHPDRIPAAWKAAEATPQEPSPPPFAAPARLDANSTSAEMQLMLQISGLLVSTWRRTPHDLTKRTLQSLLNNLGLDREGQTGDQVPFKGRNHECQDLVDPGDPVEITEPGWILRNCPGDYLLAKAQVKPINPTS